MSMWGRLRTAFRALTAEDFQMMYGRPLSVGGTAGVTVNQETARTLSAYWCGVRCISEDLGVLDRFLYRREADDSRERATDDPLYALVHDAPNDYQTPAVFWQTLAFHAVSWGNGYAEIEFDRQLRPLAVHHIPPDRIKAVVVRVVDKNGQMKSKLYYDYTSPTTGKPTRFEPWELLHVPGLGYDGICGYSPVDLARRSMGVAIATETFGASFFANGATPGVALQHPGSLSPTASQNIKASFIQEHGGPHRAHGVVVLEEGMTVSKPLTIPPDDAQFLGTLDRGVEEVARWLNLPTWKLKHKMGERPGGNAEASQNEYLQGTLLPWTTRIEQELSKKLIAPERRKTFYVGHLFEKLLVVDVKTRVEAEEKWIGMGVASPEFIAKKENFPPPPKKEPAPAPPVPPAMNAPPPPAAPAPPAAVLGAPGAIDALRALVHDRINWYVAREGTRARAAAAKGADGFGAWVDEFYGEEEPALVELLYPLLRLSASLAMRREASAPASVARALAAEYVERSREELLSLRAKDLAAAVQKETRLWTQARVDELVEAVMSCGQGERHGD